MPKLTLCLKKLSHVLASTSAQHSLWQIMYTIYLPLPIILAVPIATRTGEISKSQNIMFLGFRKHQNYNSEQKKWEVSYSGRVLYIDKMNRKYTVLLNFNFQILKFNLIYYW